MSRQKNVLYIVVDDLRPQLGCYGMPWIQSPNIDALAAEGVLFERAYCQQAMCAPSRVSVFSGCRPDTTGAYDLKTPLRAAMPDVLSMPQHFKNNGYETVSIGKVYHHADDDLESWSRPPFRATGDWRGRGYLTDEAVETFTLGDRQREAVGDHRRSLGPAYEAADVPDEGYHDGIDAQKATETLHDFKDKDAPFFLGLGFHKPHLPFNSPKRYWALYDRDEVPLAANPFAPEGVTEFSLADFGELRGYFGIPFDDPIDDELARTLIHAYSACVSYVDAQVGKVVQELKDLGLYEDTVIMLWGDHGWKLGEHGSWCKHTNFEIDARAPLIVRAPGSGRRGERESGLVEFVDMYPTLCDLCGLDVPGHCEGLSFAPLLEERGRPWKSAAFSQYPRGSYFLESHAPKQGYDHRRWRAQECGDAADGGDAAIMGYTMRTDRYRYTEWQVRATGNMLARELYDHVQDPQENINAADAPENAGAVAQLGRQLAAGWRRAACCI